MSGLIAVGYFLFALFFSILSFVLWSRIALRYFRVSALHPVCHSINSVTNPIIMPLNHMFGSTSKSRLSRYDWACFCVLVIVELLKFLALGALFLGAMLPWSFLPLYTLADLIVEPLNLLFYAIIIRLIISFINPRWHHPIADLLRLVTEPVLHFGRQFIPNIAGLDFSPYVILVVIKVITLFISASLPLHLI